MEQVNLKGEAVSKVKQNKDLTDQQVSSYNRFFINAFVEVEIEDIVEAGGSESKENFEKLSEEKMSKKDYWDKMFNKGFVGKDKRVRRSKYQDLGRAIYDNYIKDLKPKPAIYKYERFGKERTSYAVPKGKVFNIYGKEYKAGRFLPKSYFSGGV